LRFGAFEVDLRAGELRKKGIKVKLQEKPFQILALLLEHAGEVVTREDLRQKLWPADIIVDFDHSLGTAIGKLRQSLGDTAQNPRFVETLSNRGYRFIAPVSAVEEGAGSPPQNSTPEDVVPPFSAFELAIPVTLPPVARSWRRRIAAVVAILLLGVGIRWFAWRQPRTPPAGLERIESLAVLPLVNVSGDDGQEYFVDGMTDELITELAKIGLLRVISRTSTMRYKASSKSLGQIARELNVDAVVEGTVLRSEDRVRITAQLIHAATDRHLWAESYERHLKDVMALQDEVAGAIASRIQIKLTSHEKAQLAASRPVDPEAYEAYLKGRYFLSKGTEAGLKKSVEYFQQSVERDPSSAPAFAGLADSYDYLGAYALLPSKEVFPKAKTAATKALGIDGTADEAHSALGLAILFFDWDWAAAEKHFKEALKLNPNNATAHQYYGEYFVAVGDADKAIAEYKRARDLDPLSFDINAQFGRLYRDARRYEEAVDQCQKTLELDPNFTMGHWCLGLAYVGKRRYSDAISEFQKARAAGGCPCELAALGYTYAVAGNRVEAQGILREMKALSQKHYPFSYLIAEVYAGLADSDRAFEWLNRAYEERDCQLTALELDPMVDGLRGDPRFQDLIRRVGLPP